AVRRRHFNPTDARGKHLFCDQFEAQLVNVEPLTHFQIADEHDDVLYAQVGLVAYRAKHGPVRPREEGVVGHRRDYSAQAKHSEVFWALSFIMKQSVALLDGPKCTQVGL